MRSILLSMTGLLSFCLISTASGQEKDDRRPRLFKGGLLKRFENLQEKVRKDREARQKELEQSRKKSGISGTKQPDPEPSRFRLFNRNKKRAESKDTDPRQPRSLPRLDPRQLDPRQRDPRLNDPLQRDPQTRNPLSNSSSRRTIAGKLSSSTKENSALSNAPLEDSPPLSPDSGVRLGIETKKGRINTAGVVVSKVIQGGPADLAGVRADDRIVSFGGSTIKKPEDVELFLRAFVPGDRTELEFIRKGKREKVLVEFPAARKINLTDRLGGPGNNNPPARQGSSTLGAPDDEPELLPLPDLNPPKQESGSTTIGNQERPKTVTGIRSNPRPGLGVTATSVTPEIRNHHGISVQQGAFLEVVDPKSAAAKAGIPQGAVIIAVDGRRINSAAGLAEVIQTYRPGDKVQMLYYQKKQLKRAEVIFETIPTQSIARNPNRRGDPSATDATRNPPKKNSVLSELSREFPRLKRVESLIERFTPQENPRPNNSGPGSSVEIERNDRRPLTNPNRGDAPNEAELKKEVFDLRNRLQGQNDQIESLREKLRSIEKLLEKENGNR